MQRPVAITLGLFIVFIVFLPFSSRGISDTVHDAVLYVGGTGPGNYSSIQAAVNNATAGATIVVYNGTYHECLIIEKSLILTGENKNNTIIDGGGNEFVVTLTAGHITISGFTITQSEKKFPFAGIYIISNYNTISNNILTDNFYGMQLGYATGYNLIISNTIFHNGRCGVYFNHSSSNRLIGNVVRDHPVNGFGLFEFSNNNTLMNNTFSENRYSGVNIRESYDNQVIGNTFIQDQVGLHKPSPEYRTVARDNIFSQNAISFEEERDAIVFTAVIFDILVCIVFLVFRKRFA